MRDECLNETVFDMLDHARRTLAKRRYDYNHFRPHSALNGATPAGTRAGAASPSGSLVPNFGLLTSNERHSFRRAEQRFKISLGV